MDSRTERAITAFVKKQIFVSRKQGACTKLVLHHVGTGGKLGPEVTTINVGDSLGPTEKVGDEHIEMYAAQIAEEASNYAEGIGQTQTFAVAAFFEDDETRVMARHAFRVKIDVEENNDEVSSEPANAEGSLKQQMRHNESLMRMTVASFGSILNTLQRQNEQLSKMVEKMFDDRVEQIEAVETLISAKHVREMETKREEVSAAQKAQLLDNLLALLPAAANKVIGRKLLPEPTDVVQMQIVRLVEALTPKEIENLFAAIDAPEKKIALAELLKLVQDRVGSVGDAPKKEN